jgi:hypothetical protein
MSQTEIPGSPHRVLRGEKVPLVITLLLAAASFFIATRQMSHSVWFDESQTVLVARQSTLWDMTSVAVQKRAYPPLFFFAVHGSLRFRDDEIGLRLPAAAFGALAVVAVFLLGRALSGSLTGALAAFLFVLTPGVMRYFVDGNAYTLLVLTSTLSTLFLLKATGSDRASDWLCYFVFALLGLGTHTMFIFYFAAQVAAGFYLRISARPAASRSWRRFAAAMLALCILEFLWVLFFLSHGGDRRTLQLARLPEVSTLVAMAGMFPGPLAAGPVAQFACWTLLGMLGGVLLFTRSRRTFWFLLIYAGLSVAGITLFLKMTLPYVAYKHGLGMFPLACIVAAHSSMLVNFRRSGSRFPWLSIAGVLVCAAVAGYGVSGAAFMAANERGFEYQDWRGAASYLSNSAGPDDAIVLSGRYDLDPLSYYYHGPATVLEVGDGSRIRGLVSGLLSQSKPPVNSTWIVVSVFGNDNPMVAKFTQSPRAGLETRTQSVITGLREQGLSAREAARFHRVRVVVASRVQKGN